DIADLLFGALVAAHGFLPGFFLLALHRGKAALAAAFTIQCLAQRQLAGAAAVLAALATAVAVVRPAAGVAVAVGLAWASGADALGVGADGCGLGSGTVGGGRRARRCLGLGKLGLFLFTQLGLAGTALILFGFQPQGFFTLTLFTLFGLGFQPAAFALFLAGLFLGSTLRSLFDLAGLGGLESSQTALHLGIRDPGRALRRVARHGRGRTCACAASRSGLAGYDHALAFGLDDHVMGPTVAEALLHMARTAAAKTQGFLSVTIAHPIFIPSRRVHRRHARADQSVCSRP